MELHNNNNNVINVNGFVWHRQHKTKRKVKPKTKEKLFALRFHRLDAGDVGKLKSQNKKQGKLKTFGCDSSHKYLLASMLIVWRFSSQLIGKS